MGTMPLRQFLQSLCCNSPWNYAVSWKLQDHQSQIVLTWEDGYCNIPKQRESMVSILDNMCFKPSDKMFRQNGEPSIYHGNLGGCPCGPAVAYMSSAQYALGVGVVGEVAFTGKYRWIISSGECDVPECPDEWLFQCEEGIKTLLLVPVVPHGVIQLGSLETVAEDQDLVTYIKDTFVAQQTCVGYSLPFTGNKEFIPQSSSSMTSTLMENIYDFSGLAMNEMESNDLNADDMYKISIVEAELHAILYSNNYNMEVFEEDMDTLINSYTSRGMMEPPLLHKDGNTTGKKNASTSFSFPSECELHKALGPAFMGSTNKYFHKSSVSDEDACSRSSLIFNGDIMRGTGLFTHEESSKNTDSYKSLTTSLGKKSADYSKGQNQFERSSVVGDDSVPWSSLTSSFVDRGKNSISNSSPSASSLESVMSTLIVEEPQKKGYSYPHARRGSKLSSVSKRRARQGDNQKARPRDRQLIQDRVKELRELIPKSAKCSIDGLLDQTVKHMLFLTSVTNQADKLRASVHHGAERQKNLKASRTKGGHQNGTIWAFELGSQQQICPIVVEDLEYPGHMLIEMLCNDHGRFLEIAEVIRRLDLTILKGEMESHVDDTWAHFIIEAPRGFHRVDIFWPLMQLLQQKPNPISCKI